MMFCNISSEAILSHHSYATMRRSLYGFSSTIWKRGAWNADNQVTKSKFMLTRGHVQCYSARGARASRLPKVSAGKLTSKEDNAFFVVRKGDLVAVYKSLSDCQAQVSTSVCHPAVSVYKGYSLCKEMEEHLASHGLKNALYSLRAVDAKEELFGNLTPCPFQQPDGLAFLVDKAPMKNSSQEEIKLMEADGSTAIVTDVSEEHWEVGSIQEQLMSYNNMSCILEFDGASRGNPGKAGAGAILRAEDGRVISRLREGVGVATCNVAEYRALILGMKHALKKGFRQIHVQGDSHLICMQVQNLWKTKHQNLVDLCKEAKDLKDMFSSFKISHVKRALNADADAEANLAIDLPDGGVYEESNEIQ